MSESATRTGRIELDNLIVDPDRHAVFVDGKDLGCTCTEFRLLQKLAEAARAKRFVPHESINAIVEELDQAEDIRNAVRVHFRRIRAKLRESDAHVRIVPYYGLGYALEVA